MELRELSAFVAVAEEGGMSAASRRLHVSQSALSQTVNALERELGVKLLVRTTRRMSLTHEGSAFLEDCQRLLVELANAEASVSAGGAPFTTIVPRIFGCSSSLYM